MKYILYVIQQGTWNKMIDTETLHLALQYATLSEMLRPAGQYVSLFERRL